MSTLEHIQSEINTLSIEEFWALYAWLGQKKQVVEVKSAEPEQHINHEALFVERLAEARAWGKRLASRPKRPRDEKWFAELRQGHQWDIKPEDIEDEPWQERDWDALFT